MTSVEERQLLERFSRRMAGIEAEVPPPPVWHLPSDVPSAGVRFQPVFGAARMVIVGVFVVLLGGSLLALLAARPTDIISPAASTPSAAPTVEDRGSFTTTGPPAGGSRWRSAVALPDGRVLVQYDDAAEVWEPETQGFKPTGSLPEVHWQASAIGLGDGRVMVVGGIPGAISDGPTDTAVIWDPATEDWTPTGSMASGRTGAALTLLPDGRVLVMGGQAGRLRADGDRSGAQMWDPAAGRMAELWDPSTGAFRPAGQTARTYEYLPSATLLPDGRVLLFGWAEEGGMSAEIWDPATETWTTAPTPATSWSAAAPLGDGRVLVVGTDAGLTTAGRAAAIWDPLSGDMEPTGPLVEGRNGPSATLLSDGRVLVAGGSWPMVHVSGDEYRDGPVTSTAEIWDPRSGTFSFTGNLKDPRTAHTALLLPDGVVFIIGGYDQVSDPVLSAEVFHPDQS